jgi:hypothetical protein
MVMSVVMSLIPAVEAGMRCGILLYRRSTFTWFSGESGPEVRDVMPVLVVLLDNAEDAIDACRLDSAVRVPTESTLRQRPLLGVGVVDSR